MDLVIGDGLNKTTIRESHETQSKVARLSQTVVSDNAVRKVNFRYCYPAEIAAKCRHYIALRHNFK